MPQDPDLYGQPPPKRQKKQMALSSSLDFTSQLTSLISKPSTSTSTTSTARPRPSKSKTADLFSSVKAKRRPGAKQPNPNPDPNNNKLTLRDPTTTHDELANFSHAQRKLEEKARLYSAMKRGDYVPKEGESAPLVDFDRKWAEAQSKGLDLHEEEEDNTSGSDNASEAEPEEMIEYEDEFGRLRTAPKSTYLLHQRRLARGLAASAELAEMAARPVVAPENIIYGETIQSEAFFSSGNPDKMEELARKRDRSATPPEARHYDATEEIRNRGTGFYAFSKDEEDRQKAMENLKREREETERVRREREDAREKRRREIEERRKAVMERRRGKDAEKAKTMADSFLAAFEPELLAKRDEREPSVAAGGEAGKDDVASEENKK